MLACSLGCIFMGDDDLAKAIDTALETPADISYGALAIELARSDIPAGTKNALMAGARAHLWRASVTAIAQKKQKKIGGGTEDEEGGASPAGSHHLPSIARASEQQQQRVLLAQLRTCEEIADSGSVALTPRAAAALLGPVAHIAATTAAPVLKRARAPFEEVLRLVRFSCD